jgi:hypothetical protein
VIKVLLLTCSILSSLVAVCIRAGPFLAEAITREPAGNGISAIGKGSRRLEMRPIL